MTVDFDFGCNSAKRKRAIASCKPYDMRKRAISRIAEKKVAKQVGGTKLPYHNPFDVVIGEILLEVKTLIDPLGANRITIHSDAKKKKLDQMKELGAKRAGIVVVDYRKNELTGEPYFRWGIGSFSLGTFKAVPWNKLREVIV
jgi:hypothetical protein